MNALVTYYSQTGNTLAIAKALYEELSEHCSCTLQILDECGMSSLNEYDLILIGSPCHAGTLAAPVREFLSLLPDAPSFHLAGFITHASSVYQKSDYENSITFLRSLCSSKRISYHGCFECRGNLTADLHDYIKRKKTSPMPNGPGWLRKWKDIPTAKIRIRRASSPGQSSESWNRLGEDPWIKTPPINASNAGPAAMSI